MAIPIIPDTPITGTAAMSAFNIEMNSSMFSMLTKNVYTNVIMAPIRELGTNAIDACIAAGNPIQFDVTLPTLLSPDFTVRDYGTGLAPDDIAGLFSTLGASTKRESNAYNGTFGIGRMSGLAYTDSFTVDSYYNGTKYSRLITAADGIPQMVTLGDSPTDEPNGLSLTIAVANEDINKFVSTAAQVYSHFSHKPTTNIPLEYHEWDASLEGDDWKLVTTDYNSPYYDSLVVLMGNVAYTSRSYSGISDKAAPLINYTTLVLDVPIGCVAITPGRESLNFDDTTVAYLNAKLEAIVDSIYDIAVATIHAADTSVARGAAYRAAKGVLPSRMRYDFKYPFDTYPQDEKIFHQSYSTLDYDKKFLADTNQVMILCKGYKTLSALNDAHTFTDYPILIADTRLRHVQAAIAHRDTLTDKQHILVIRPLKYDKNTIQQDAADTITRLTDLGFTNIHRTSDYVDDVITKSATSTTPTIAADFLPISLTCSFGKYGRSVYATRANSPIKSTDTKKYFYVEYSGYDPTSMKNTTLAACIAVIQQYNAQYPDKYINLIGIPKKGLPAIRKDNRFTLLTVDILKPYASQLHVADYSIQADMVREGVLHNICALMSHSPELPTDLSDFLSAVESFEDTNAYRQNRYYLSSEDYELFPYEVVKPATAHDYDWLVSTYGLTTKLIKNFYDFKAEDISTCANLEYYKRTHNE